MTSVKTLNKAGTMLAVVALVVAFTVAPASAHNKWRGGDKDPGIAANRMAEKLDLTAEQQTQVEEILAKNYKKRELQRKEHKQEMKEQLSEVLTAEQMKDLEEMRIEHREERREHKRRGGKHHR